MGLFSSVVSSVQWSVQFSAVSSVYRRVQFSLVQYSPVYLVHCCRSMIIVQPFTRSLSFIRKNSISFLNIIPGTMASSSSSSWQSRTKVTGVIFDMDGTLTEEHAIDFKAMYNRIGIKKRGDDIITQVKEDLHEEEHQRAFDIIVDEEMLGCERMKVKEDLHDCISFLTERDIKMAISTRNCREGMTIHHNMIPAY